MKHFIFVTVYVSGIVRGPRCYCLFVDDKVIQVHEIT